MDSTKLKLIETHQLVNKCKNLIDAIWIWLIPSEYRWKASQVIIFTIKYFLAKIYLQNGIGNNNEKGQEDVYEMHQADPQIEGPMYRGLSICQSAIPSWL